MLFPAELSVYLKLAMSWWKDKDKLDTASVLKVFCLDFSKKISISGSRHPRGIIFHRQGH